MVIRQGDVYWADLGAPRGSAPADRRPVVVIQSDPFNQSRLRTVMVIRHPAQDSCTMPTALARCSRIGLLHQRPRPLLERQ